jgi:hypothetical protein
MDRCMVVLTNDTGLMHVAAARKRKVVAVFGSTARQFGFFPFGTRSVVVEHPSLNCRPCTHIGRPAYRPRFREREFACQVQDGNMRFPGRNGPRDLIAPPLLVGRAEEEHSRAPFGGKGGGDSAEPFRRPDLRCMPGGRTDADDRKILPESCVTGNGARLYCRRLREAELESFSVIVYAEGCKGFQISFRHRRRSAEVPVHVVMKPDEAEPCQFSLAHTHNTRSAHAEHPAPDAVMQIHDQVVPGIGNPASQGQKLFQTAVGGKFDDAGEVWREADQIGIPGLDQEVHPGAGRMPPEHADQRRRKHDVADGTKADDECFT